jgi:hypothetical protein
MFNLLPEKIRAEIRKEYNHRRLVMILVFVIFLQVAFTIFLFPTWLMSVNKEKDVIIRSEDMNKNLSNLNIASTTANIKSINTQLTIIDNKLQYPDIVSFINLVLSKKATSTTISDIVFVVNSAKKMNINLQGVSATRDTLSAFSKNLQKIEEFKAVDVPLSSYTKDKNLSFSVEIKIETK